MANGIRLNQNTTTGDLAAAFDDGTYKHTGAWVNTLERNTYIIPINRLINVALTANTTTKQISLEHAATAVKRVKIRKVRIGALNTTAVAGDLRVYIDYGTAASTGGTAITPQPVLSSQPAAEVTVKSLPTIVAATTKFVDLVGSVPATANSVIPGLSVYEWYPGSEERLFELRAGFLESLVIGIQSFAANVYHISGFIVITEE